MVQETNQEIVLVDLLNSEVSVNKALDNYQVSKDKINFKFTDLVKTELKLTIVEDSANYLILQPFPHYFKLSPYFLLSASSSDRRSRGNFHHIFRIFLFPCSSASGNPRSKWLSSASYS